jgi:hypothetical protein
MRPIGRALRGSELSPARAAARLNGLQILAVLRAELGDLRRVRRVVKIFGMVNCLTGFNRAPAVIDGCSDLLVQVFGDAGRGAGPQWGWPNCHSISR